MREIRTLRLTRRGLETGFRVPRQSSTLPKMSKLEFRPNASIKEITDAFVSSGIFDVVKFDPDKRKAKKPA